MMPKRFDKRAKKILQEFAEEYKENKTAFERDKNFSSSSLLRKKLKGLNEKKDNSEE